MSFSNNPTRSIVLRQYPSFPSAVQPVSPKEVSPTVIYTRSPPQQPINPTVATTLVRQPRIMMAPPIATQAKIIRVDHDDNESIEGSEYSDTPSDRRHRKLLSGFHPYYDKETDIMGLQCCTCCIGCWRKCWTRCTGCENFISCPIYCWLLFILPVFLLLVAGLVVTSVYAAHVFG